MHRVKEQKGASPEHPQPWLRSPVGECVGACERFHLQPSEPDWSSLAVTPVYAFRSDMSGHMVWPGWRCSSFWLLSELEITQRAHETREDRFERRDVLEAIIYCKVIVNTVSVSPFKTQKLILVTLIWNWYNTAPLLVCMCVCGDLRIHNMLGIWKKCLKQQRL